MKKILFLLGLFMLFGSFKIEVKKDDGLDLCNICVQTMSETIQELLDIILNAGVIGGCSELCSLLGPKFGKIVVTACDLICDAAGIEAFIALIKKADLDPIWLCQEIRLCPVHDCTLPTCAKFLSHDIRPNPGQIGGGKVQLQYTFEVMEQTGTGEIMCAIQTAKGSDPPVVEGGELVPKGYEKGNFQIAMEVEFKDDESAEPPVIFMPGVYTAHMYLCEGQCGSKHAHTRVLAEDTAQFNMTK